MICYDFIEHNETVDRLYAHYLLYILYILSRINQDTRKATGNVLTQKERGNTNVSEQGQSPFCINCI